jgi:hypothetical protein
MPAESPSSPPTLLEKSCSRCGVIKALEEFSVDRACTSSGHKACCKVCERATKRERYGSTPKLDVYGAIRTAGHYDRVAWRTAAGWRRQDKYKAMTDEQLALEITKGAPSRDLLAEIQRRSTRLAS